MVTNKQISDYMPRKPVLTHTYLNGYLEAVCRKLWTREDKSSFRGLVIYKPGSEKELNILYYEDHKKFKKIKYLK